MQVHFSTHLILLVSELGSNWGGRVDHVEAFYPRQLVLSILFGNDVRHFLCVLVDEW